MSFLGDSFNSLNSCALYPIINVENTFNFPRLQACIKGQDDSQVRVSSKEGDLLGVDSTPTMFINGEKISGAVPTEAMLPIINRALREAGVDIPYAAQPPADAPKVDSKDPAKTDPKPGDTKEKKNDTKEKK